MWMVYTTVNFDDHEDDYTQGPWTLREVHSFIDLMLEGQANATSFVFTIVPKPED